MSRCKEPAIPADLTDRLLADGDDAAALQHGGVLDLLELQIQTSPINRERLW